MAKDYHLIECHTSMCIKGAMVYLLNGLCMCAHAFALTTRLSFCSKPLEVSYINLFFAFCINYEPITPRW